MRGCPRGDGAGEAAGGVTVECFRVKLTIYWAGWTQIAHNRNCPLSCFTVKDKWGHRSFARARAAHLIAILLLICYEQGWYTANAGNRDVIFEYTRVVQKDLGNLSKQRPSPILARLKAFEDAWRSDVPLDQLRSSYDFKQVSSDQQCKRGRWVYQIHLLRDYRAHMTYIESMNACYWIAVFVKNSATQQAAIVTSCNRAATLQRRGVQ